MQGRVTPETVTKLETLVDFINKTARPISAC